MESDKQTKEKLLLAAKKEFMEKGYHNASLRNICRESGVTTGALYFFFRDKNDLFRELIEAPLNKLYHVMNRHYEDERNYTESEISLKMDFADDFRIADEALDVIYDNLEEFQILLMKADGSAYENIVDSFIEISEKHYRIMADMMSRVTNNEKIDDYMIHWISHLQNESFAQLVEHQVSKAEAKLFMQRMIRFLIHGWMSMFAKD